MHSIEIPEKNITLNFPESALEFTRKQLLAFSNNLTLYNADKLDYTQFKVNVVYNFLNLKRKANLSKLENQAIPENINTISNLVENFFISKDDTLQLKMDFYKQNLPSFSVDNKMFYGPTDAFFNTVYGEYLACMSFFTDFSKTKDEAFLDKIIATIYRPKKADYKKAKHQQDFDGDIRVKYNPNLTDVYVKSIKKLPFHIKYAIYLYVASCQHFIANNQQLAIGGGNSIDLTVLFNKEQVQDNTNSLGMVGTLYSLAETKVFGSIKEVAEQRTFDVLAFLVNQTHQYNKLKRKTNAST